MARAVSDCEILCYDRAVIPMMALLQPSHFIFFLLKKQFNRIRSTVPVQFSSVLNFHRHPVFPSRYDRDYVRLLVWSSGYLDHLPFPDMRDFDENIADKIGQRAEIPLCPHCDIVLLQGMSYEFCCKTSAGRIKNHLLPPIGRELLDHIVEFTQPISTFPRILNRDLRPVLQHARVSSPNAGALNVFISGIPCASDSSRQLITSVYAVFFRTQSRIVILLGGTEEIIASILSQNGTLQGYLRDRLASVREIATVAMDEPDNGMNLAIFKAEGDLLGDHQLEVVRNSHHTQKLSQVHMVYNQLVYPLIFWTGSGGCSAMESEKLQGCTTLIRKVLISLILQPRDHFIHQLITLGEEFFCAVFGCLVHLNIKVIAQARRRYFAREDEIMDQNPEGVQSNMDL
jgi:hypothetical protein